MSLDLALVNQQMQGNKPGNLNLALLGRNTLPFPAGVEYRGDFGNQSAGTFASMGGKNSQSIGIEV